MTFPGYPWVRISVQYNMEFRTKYFYLKLTVKAAVGSHYTSSYSRFLPIIVGCVILRELTLPHAHIKNRLDIFCRADTCASQFTATFYSLFMGISEMSR